MILKAGQSFTFYTNEFVEKLNTLEPIERVKLLLTAAEEEISDYRSEVGIGYSADMIYNKAHGLISEALSTLGRD